MCITYTCWGSIIQEQSWRHTMKTIREKLLTINARASMILRVCNTYSLLGILYKFVFAHSICIPPGIPMRGITAGMDQGFPQLQEAVVRVGYRLMERISWLYYYLVDIDKDPVLHSLRNGTTEVITRSRRAIFLTERKKTSHKQTYLTCQVKFQISIEVMAWCTWSYRWRYPTLELYVVQRLYWWPCKFFRLDV